jgi:hypothetical protein
VPNYYCVFLPPYQNFDMSYCDSLTQMVEQATVTTIEISYHLYHCWIIVIMTTSVCMTTSMRHSQSKLLTAMYPSAFTQVPWVVVHILQSQSLKFPGALKSVRIVHVSSVTYFFQTIPDSRLCRICPRLGTNWCLLMEALMDHLQVHWILRRLTQVNGL